MIKGRGHATPSMVATLLAAAFLTGCQTPSSTEGLAAASVAATDDCASSDARIDKDFAAGAFQQCKTIGDQWFSLSITPEDEPPINCSAWYAFRVTRTTPGPVDITLDYAACGHRYRPKISENGRDWTVLDANAVKTSEDNRTRASFRVEVGDSPLFVAAQEIIVPATYETMIASYVASDAASAAPFATSVEGRPISSVTIAEPGHDQREQIILIGRQHPPEVTGALAMHPFVETLLGDDALAQRFRQRFETIVVPLMNPDGVTKGHWRHNVNGKDLNRDWGPFTEPETQAMDRLLKAIDADAGRDLRLFIDFHSTGRDIFYIMPDDAEVEPHFIIKRWLDNYAARMPGYEVERDAGHNVGMPTAKTYIYERYGVPTATFELGDETDRALIDRIGRQAAIAMMEEMLATPPSE